MNRVISDDSEATMARFSACKGYGIQGWIFAFNETIVIKPSSWLKNPKLQRKHHTHRINGHHIVYKYNDLDRSDYDTECGNNANTSHDHDHRTGPSYFDNLAKNIAVLFIFLYFSTYIHVHFMFFAKRKRLKTINGDCNQMKIQYVT